MLKKIEGILVFLLLIFLLSTLTLRLFGVETYVIASDSMAPNYRVNDLTYVKKESDVIKDDLKVGDVIAFNLNGQLVMHRIIALEDTHLITKGDNNDVADDQITYNQVYGMVGFNLKFGGILLNLYFWIIVMGLYVATLITKSIIKEFKKGA